MQGRGVALASRLAIPGVGQQQIFLHALPDGEQRCQVTLGIPMALQRRPSIPTRCQGEILLDALTGLKQHAQIVLRIQMVVRRQLAKQRKRLDIIALGVGGDRLLKRRTFGRRNPNKCQ